jgi:hypothetical protein
MGRLPDYPERFSALGIRIGINYAGIGLPSGRASNSLDNRSR